VLRSISGTIFVLPVLGISMELFLSCPFWDVGQMGLMIQMRGKKRDERMARWKKKDERVITPLRGCGSDACQVQRVPKRGKEKEEELS
jgi:hypothetical protein